MGLKANVLSLELRSDALEEQELWAVSRLSLRSSQLDVCLLSNMESDLLGRSAMACEIGDVGIGDVAIYSGPWDNTECIRYAT